MRFTGDSLEMEAVTSGPELALVLEYQTAPTAATPYFRPDNKDLPDVESA